MKEKRKSFCADLVQWVAEVAVAAIAIGFIMVGCHTLLTMIQVPVLVSAAVSFLSGFAIYWCLMVSISKTLARRMP